MDPWQPSSEAREIEREMTEALQWQQLAEVLAERAVATGWTQGQAPCDICSKHAATTFRCPAGHVLHVDCGLIDVDPEAGGPVLVCPLCHPSESHVDVDESNPQPADVIASAVELGWSLARGRQCQVCLSAIADEPLTLCCPQAGHVVHAGCCGADDDLAPTCPLCEGT